MHWKIPLFTPELTEADVSAACEPIRDGWLTMGERTQRFEEAFALRTGSKHAYGVTNCTAALHLALAAVGVKAGDEVCMPPLTFVACANVTLALGAEPVFVDLCSDDDWTLSPDDLERKITPKTRAVVVVHFAGFPCRMDEINAVAKKHGLHVIEDCAHSLVSEYNGTSCGALGDVGCFSFFSNKNMTTGEGGMMTVQDDALAERLRLLRSHGMTTLTIDRHKGYATSYDVLGHGFNYRIDEMRSAIGLAQLQRLDGFLARRSELYQLYIEQLNDVDEIIIPFRNNEYGSIGYHIFCIALKETDRAAFMNGMTGEGIQTSIHYPPIHQFTAFKRYKDHAQCPITDFIGAREVTLPFYPAMTEDNVKTVCNAVKKYVRQGK